jgi:hypothetical protein
MDVANPMFLRMHVSLAVALLRIPRFFVFAREKLQSMDCTNGRTFTIQLSMDFTQNVMQ